MPIRTGWDDEKQQHVVTGTVIDHESGSTTVSFVVLAGDVQYVCIVPVPKAAQEEVPVYVKPRRRGEPGERLQW